MTTILSRVAVLAGCLAVSAGANAGFYYSDDAGNADGDIFDTGGSGSK